MFNIKNIKLLFVPLLFISLLALGQEDEVKKEKPLVFKMKLDSEIDPRTNRYSDLALNKAREKNVDFVIIEMDTYGGALNRSCYCGDSRWGSRSR